MILVLFLIFFVYIFFVVACTTAWIKKRSFDCTYKATDVFLSLVVCAKNEEESLPLLLRSIEGQIDKIDRVVLIDDHSKDSTFSFLSDFAGRYKNVLALKAVEYGKKNALRQAVESTNSNYILVSDADCIIEKNYFSLVKEAIKVNKPDLMIGAVRYKDGGSFFSKIQSLEFASLAAITAGTAILGCPIMCNGANLAFSRDVWQKAKNQLVETEQSGDDVFLLHFIKKIKGKIIYLKHPNGFVETFSCHSLKAFFNQRKRWASKSKSYKDLQTIFVAIVVLITNIAVVGCFCLSFINHNFLWLILLKMLADSFLLIPFLSFFSQQKLIKFIPFVSLIYPFYIIIAAFGGLLGSFQWKKV